MSSGFEPGGDDRIHACRLKCCCLIWCCRPADCDDAFPPALVQDFSWRDSNDEAEYRDVSVQQHASLIFKSDWRIRFEFRTRRPQGGEMWITWRKAPVECVFIRCSGSFVFHRDPQVHCERFRCERANLCDHVFDHLRSQAVRTKRSEPAEV